MSRMNDQGQFFLAAEQLGIPKYTHEALKLFIKAAEDGDIQEFDMRGWDTCIHGTMRSISHDYKVNTGYSKVDEDMWHLFGIGINGTSEETWDKIKASLGHDWNKIDALVTLKNAVKAVELFLQGDKLPWCTLAGLTHSSYAVTV